MLFFLYALKKGNADDERYRKMLINIFLVAAYLYDDKITYVLTAGDKTLTVTDSLLDAIDASNADYESSFMNDTAPPDTKTRPRGGFFRVCGGMAGVELEGRDRQ